MKKVYLLAGALVVGSVASAQIIQTSIPAKQSREHSYTKKKQSAVNTAKAEGDTLWFNDFSTPSDWTISNLGTSGTPPHTAGDWAIVNAMPASLTSQAPSYGFPTAMNSDSQGNFALVNSDAAGAAATQNALLTVSSGIDLSSAGNSALYLRFTEIYRHYYDENYVQVSNDGGNNWMEFAVNPVSQVPVNTNSGDPEIEVLNITPVIGAGTWGSDVRIRFRYQGAYDWFWGVDDVMIVEAWDNDVKINNWYQAAGAQVLDYYIVNQSQTSFPGLTFGAIVENNGAVTQPDVALHVTAPSLSYDEMGTTVSIATGETDSVSVETPLIPSNTVGDYPVTISLDMNNTDSDPANNTQTMTIRRDQWWFSRDDGQLDGAISQVTSQTDAALRIGNVMEIFDPMDVSFVQVRLVNQAAAVGQQIYAEIHVLDGGTGEFEFMAETQPHDIVNGDLNNFVTMPLDGGVLSLSAGDLILVVAGHYGGANEVAFGLAQPTFASSVLGFTANGESFQLTDPNAVMIRISDQTLSVDENEAQFGVNVFPNPSVDQTTVAFELPNAADVTVSVTDLAGKTVYTNAMANTAAGKHQVSINTAELAGGVYTVNFHANNTVVTKKLVVKK